MVQKEYKLEIILNLLQKGENHLRSIAADLETPHTTVLRKLNSLVDENVVDFRVEGKNKVFFLKKTLNARNYAYMAEHYKLKKFLEKYPEFSIIIKEILEEAREELVVLFGSYARLEAKKGSDIDLFVEGRDTTLRSRLKQVNDRINVKLGDFDTDNKLIKEIIKDHVILRGVEVFYDKNKFFG